MSKYFKSHFCEKSAEATILKQRKLFAAILPISALPRTFPLDQLRKYWTYFEVPERERMYAAYALGTSQQLCVQYCSRLKKLARLRCAAEASFKILESAVDVENEHQRYVQMQRAVLRYFRAVNDIRVLTDSCVDGSLRETDILEAVCNVMPDRAFFERILVKSGMSEEDSRQQIDNYAEQMSSLIPQLQSLFLLIGQEIQLSYFPYNYSALVYTKSNQPFDGRICAFAAQLVLDEAACKQRQEQRESKFTDAGAVQCVVPVLVQSQLFDLYSAKHRYVSDELKTRICEPYALGSAESLSLAQNKALQQSGNARISFYDAYMRCSIKSCINEQLLSQSSAGPPIEEFKEFYEQFHISLAEEEVINGLCQQQRHYAVFMQNCSDLRQVIDAYKKEFQRFQAAVNAKKYDDLPDCCGIVADLIDEARRITGRPVQLPLLRTGFDVLLLQFQNLQKHINAEAVERIGTAFKLMLEQEGALQDKYQRDLELAGQSGMCFLTVRVDDRNVCNLYRYAQE